MMEPFVLRDDSQPPHLSLAAWLKDFDHLIAGFSVKGACGSPGIYDYSPDAVSRDRAISLRQRLCSSLGISPDSWAYAEQVHGRNIERVLAGRTGNVGRADGLWTSDAGILLTATFADCVPLFFYDPATDIIGLAHAGLRGTLQNIAQEMVRRLVKFGADPPLLRAAIGPAIGGCCYTIDGPTASRLRDLLPDRVSEALRPARHGDRYFVDLKSVNAALLRLAGVKHICASGYCTGCNPELFFSYRRRKDTGRMIGFVAKRPKEPC